MKILVYFSLFLLSSLGSSSVFAQETQPTVFELSLSNGNIFVCQLDSGEESSGFVSALNQQPIEFDFEQIRSLTPRKNAQQAVSLPAWGTLPENQQGVVVLSNGDYLIGSLASLDSEQMIVNSSMGELTIPLDYVQQIFSRDESKLLYSYDQLQENDVLTREKPVERVDGLLKIGSLTQVMLPEQLPSAYQLELESPMPLKDLLIDFSFHLSLRGDADQNSYYLQLRRDGALQLRAPGKTFAGGMNRFNQGRNRVDETKNLLLDERAKEPGSRIVISVDRSTGTIVVRANNGLPISFEGLAEVKEEMEFDRLIAFMKNQGQRNEANVLQNPDYSYLMLRPNSRDISLSRIRLWKQEAGTSAPMGFVSDSARQMNRGGALQTYLYLNNGDALMGQITGLDQQSYLVRVQGVEIPVPKARVSEISFLQAEADFSDLSQENNQDLFRVRLKDGSQLTLTLLEFAQDGFLARSTFMSEKLIIPLSQCLKVERLSEQQLTEHTQTEKRAPMSLTQPSSQDSQLSGKVEFLGLPAN